MQNIESTALFYRHSRLRLDSCCRWPARRRRDRFVGKAELERRSKRPHGGNHHRRCCNAGRRRNWKMDL